MSEYGQSIPTKIYREFVRVDATRAMLWDRLFRMLEAVGMLPVHPQNHGLLGFGADGGAFNYTLENSDNAAILSRRMAFFDFPTTEYLTINGVQYRPFIYMTTGDGGNASYVTSAYEGNQIMLNHGLRRNTAQWSQDDVITWNKSMGRTAYNGFMQGDANASTYDNEFSGLNPATSNWKTYSAYVHASYTLLHTVQHWFAYLGPSGLVIALGSADSTNAQNKSTLFDIMNGLFLFGGARIPNRARMPIADVNLNRIDPIVTIPCYESGGFHNANGDPYFNALAVGFDLKNSIADGQSVYGRIANLDNIDRPFSTLPSQLRPVPSPRVVGSVGRHILSRMIYMITNGYEVAGIDYSYCPVDVDYNTTVNLWEDCWCCPEVRFTDNRAPIGLYTDPDTGVQWHLHYWNYRDVGVALKAVAPTVLSALPSRAYGSEQTYPMDITGSSIAAGELVTAAVLCASPRLLAVHQQLTTNNAQRWQVTPGENYMEQSCGAFAASQGCVYFAADLPAGETLTKRWQIQFDAYVRGGLENNDSYTLRMDVYDLIRSWVNVYKLQSAGANAGNAAYNYASRPAVSLLVDVAAATTWYTLPRTAAPLLFRIYLFRNNAANGTLTSRVGNFRLISTPVV